jgi:dolichol-phosphate mannosyltransferase
LKRNEILQPKTISIVVPVFNNSGSLAELSARLIEVTERINDYIFEIIFVDDGSTDKSFQELCGIKDLLVNKKVMKIIKLNRNYGQMAAILAGWQAMSGVASVVISADLQDAPEEIIKLIEASQDGCELVIATREFRRDAPMLQLTSKVAYYFIRKKYPKYPKGGFDFYFLSYNLVREILKLKGSNRYLQPEIISLGYNMEFVQTTREARRHGKSGYNFSKRLDFLITALIDISPRISRLLATLGFIGIALSFILSLSAIYNRLVGEIAFSGFTTLFCFISFFSGIQVLSLSVINEYVWRIYDSNRQRATFIVASTY